MINYIFNIYGTKITSRVVKCDNENTIQIGMEE